MSQNSDDLMEYDEAATTAMDLTNLNDSQLDAAATALNEEIDDDRVQDALATLPAGKNKMPAAAAAAGGLFGDNVLTIEKPTKRKAATAAEAAFVENVDSDGDVNDVDLKTLYQKGNATLARPVDQSELEFSDSDDDDYLKKKAKNKYDHLTTEHYVNRQLKKDNAELEKKMEESNKLEIQVMVPLKLYHNDHPDEKGMIGVLAAAFVKALGKPDLRDALIGATDVLKSSIALCTDMQKTKASIDVGNEKLQELKERAEQKAGANAELMKNVEQFINSQKKPKKKHNEGSSSRQ